MTKKMNLSNILIVLTFLFLFLMYGSGMGLCKNRRSAPDPTEGISADQVINKYLTAIGGKDRIKKLTSKRILYKVFMVKRGGYTVEQLTKRSGYLKICRVGAQQYTLFEKNKFASHIKPNTARLASSVHRTDPKYL